MINYGIDLGTTNSAIAVFNKGKVEVLTHPIGLKNTLPSVVAFINDRILVGEKAREYWMKAPEEVVGSFKRKMGTSESYPISSIQEEKSPVELSALVLKELKQFVQSDETPRAAVVTIPASFDTIQSNATKKAGELAGFEQVVLLQEPIAASLAYANLDRETIHEDGQWLVYDLGGGTFDVALVEIRAGEMKVLDHEGDNFLGGNDFDRQIVEKMVIPWLEENGTFENLLHEMKSGAGKYNSLFLKLLLLAEDAKKELSEAETTDIEFETEDDSGTTLQALISISRKGFEALLKPALDQTIAMTQAILDRNKIAAKDLMYVLMVGGSTYIPAVREQVATQLEVTVNTGVDPTTAVAVGAAFYAGTQRLSVKRAEKRERSDMYVNFAYQKATQDEEEYFAAKFSGAFGALFYRITRNDGGYDSGQKPVKEQISEFLPLVKDTFNEFEINIYDALGNSVDIGENTIGITQGRYSVAGQPLPYDICLEIDDRESGTTSLDPVFAKNNLLPLKKTLTKTVTRTIARGSDEILTIHVLEGPASALPAANQPIGFISISGKDLSRDLIKGSDIEVILEMSESRDLKITAYLMMTDQEFEDVFTPSERQVSVHRLMTDFEVLIEKLEKEVEEAQELENYETAHQLLDIQQELLELSDQVKAMPADDITDEKFQLEDRKRKIAQTVDELTREKHVLKIKMEYFDAKRNMEFVMDNYNPTESERTELANTLAKEKEYLATNSTIRIRQIIEYFFNLSWKIRSRNPEYLKLVFYFFVSRHDEFKNKRKGEELVAQGENAIKNQNWDMLRVYINQLSELLPSSLDDMIRGGTGIG